MSDWPVFLTKSNPANPVLDYGQGFTSSQLNALNLRCHHLQYTPRIVVCPANFQVKDGHHLISEISTGWELGPNSLLVIISPSQHQSWVGCGSTLSASGITQEIADQIMTRHHLQQWADKHLYSHLYGALGEFDRTITSPIATAVPSPPSYSSYPKSISSPSHSTVEFLPIFITFIGLALIFVAVAAAAMAQARKADYERLRMNSDNNNDTTDDASLEYDLDRIRHLVTHQEGTPVAPLKSQQVPMAEFAKRARHTETSFSVKGEQANVPESSTEANTSSISANTPSISSISEVSANQNATSIPGENIVPIIRPSLEQATELSPAQTESSSVESQPLPNAFVVTAAYEPGAVTSAAAYPVAYPVPQDASVTKQVTEPTSNDADIKCPKCQAMTPKAFSFCLKCGENLA